MFKAEFLQHLISEKRFSQHTIKSYKVDIEQFVDYLENEFKVCNVDEISFQLIRRWIVLLLASYYFYMSWNPAFIILIITSTLIDYWAGLKIHSSKKHKKKFLVISLASNLSLLFFFKYFNFFVGSISDITSIIGYDPIFNPWNIILPVGISFYTFQTLSYSIDIYKGKLEPITHIGKFALFVTFFPQLVAGPIERAKNLIPQVLNLGKITKEKIEIASSFEGIFLKMTLWYF